MALSFRQTTRAGPLRVTFSKAGPGVSTGIPRFRLKTGPHAASVQLGDRGLHYCESHGTAQGLLAEIRRRQATPPIGPWVMGGVTLLFLMTWGAQAQALVLGPLFVACVGAAYWASLRDAVRRIVLIEYQLDSAGAEAFEALGSAVAELNRVAGLWYVPARGQVKAVRHVGASHLTRRDRVRPKVGRPTIIRTNLDVPSLRIDRKRLYFFPDRLMVFEGDQVGAASYADLGVEIGHVDVAEQDRLPRDAQVVGRTWLYVDKRGEPDRRFKDNRELQVARYETIHLKSGTVLSEVLHASRPGVGAPIAAAVAALAEVARSGTGAGSDTSDSPEDGPDPAREGRAPDDEATARARSADASSLRRGKAAAAIAGQAPGWEYRTFGLALMDVLMNPPAVSAPPMPSRFAVGSQVVHWVKAQLEVVRQVCGAMAQLVNVDLPAKVGARDADAILELAWQVGRKAAFARAWAAAVKATDVPARFNPVRDELARTLDHPVKTVVAYAPQLLSALDAAPASGKVPPVPRIAFTLPNQEALRQAIKTAMQ